MAAACAGSLFSSVGTLTADEAKVFASSADIRVVKNASASGLRSLVKITTLNMTDISFKSRFAKHQILMAVGLLCIAQIAAAEENSLILNEAVVLDNAQRIVHIHYASTDKSGAVDRVTDGSGFLLDGKHAITAAHVIREAQERNEPVIVQVGAGANGNYLTTATVERVDYRRDLAMLYVNTYTLVPIAQNPGRYNLVAGAPVLDRSPARICSSRVPAGSQYALGGLAVSSTGNDSSIEFHWAPVKYSSVLDVTSLPKLEVQPDVPHWNWRTGDPVIVLGESANEGDSGGAVFSTDGCFMGVTSANVRISYQGVEQRGVTLAAPILPNDPFLKGTKRAQQ
ncbi:serine protease [Paraburkholderia sp. IMGN_8]|uniref:S1 family peptidase n=1 Tax=Paraburkholderia sp. IMGN_8 TaxID=3136564 RepID=UPI00310131F6